MVMPLTAVVVMNARPALWDEVAREHAEARTRSLRNRRLLDWSVMKGLLAWFVGDEGAAGGCGADVRRRLSLPCQLFYMLKVQG
jgi:hypothetical protein